MYENVCFLNRYLVAVVIFSIPIAFFAGAASEDLLDFLPWRNRHRRRRKKK
jgi:hypothetical protein